MTTQPTQPLTDAGPLAIEQWARDMAAFSGTVADVLRYEGETLHAAVVRGAENAGRTITAALGLDQDGKGQA